MLSTPKYTDSSRANAALLFDDVLVPRTKNDYNEFLIAGFTVTFSCSNGCLFLDLDKVYLIIITHI